jgi:hypothetical protein
VISSIPEISIQDLEQVVRIRFKEDFSDFRVFMADMGHQDRSYVVFWTNTWVEGTSNPKDKDYCKKKNCVIMVLRELFPEANRVKVKFDW